jgi:hypothetical protein
MRFTHYERGAMNLKLNCAELRLQARDLARLSDAAGTRVRCVLGSLWITQDGDQNDYQLGPGATLVLDRPGLTLIHALRPSEVTLCAPVPAREAREPLWTAIANRLRGASA